MKTPASSLRRAFSATLASLGILTGSPFVQAAILTWDPGQTPATPSGGTGTWDNSSLFWSNGSSDVAWTNSILNDTALFAGTADVVTVGSAISALGLEFSSGYALTGSPAITLGTGGIVTDASAGLVRVQNTGGVTLGAAQSWNIGSGSALSVSGPINNGGFLLTLTGSGSTSLTGIISGTGGLTQNNSGTLTLTGVNTFSGGLTVSSGTVSISANTALGGASGTAGAVSLNGGTLKWTGAGVTNTHVITVGASGGTINQLGTGTYILGNANNLAGSGALTITGNGTLASAGSTNNGVVVFGNSNTYNGNVILQDGGVAEYANANGVASGGTFTVNNNGMLSANGVTIARNVTLNAGGSLAFQNGNTGVFSGNITLNGDASIRLQDWWSTTVRSGTISNAITGAHTINVNSGSSNLGTGGTLTLGGFDAKASSADLVLNGASLAINSGSGTAAASVTRGNSLTINTGNLNVTGVASQATNDVFGTLNLGNGTGGSAGTLQGYSTWAITPNAATNAALTFTNMGTRTAGSWVAINGTVGATPAANTANIYFTNAPSGSNLIGSGGTLSSGTASVIPWLRDTSGGNIYGYDATNGVAAITTVSTSNLNTATSGQNVTLTAGQTLTGSKTINSLQTAFQSIDMGGNTLTVSSGVITADNATFSNGTLNFGTAEAQLSVHQVRTLNISGNIAGSGGLTFVGFSVGSSKGSLVLGGTNTYTGTTNFYGYGGGANSQISLTNSLALQNTTLNHVSGRGYTLNFGNGGTSGQTAYTFGALSGNADINLNNNNTTVGTVALTVGGNNSSTTYSGVLSSTVAGGSLIKTGTGTFTLSGANTFTGATKVNAGTLALGNVNALQKSPLDLTGAGAFTFTVSGTNTYNIGGLQGAGAFTISANSLSMDSAAVSSLSIADGTVYQSSPAVSVTGTGTLTFNSTLTVSVGSLLSMGLHTFDLFGGTATLAGNFTTISIVGSYTATLNSGNSYAFTDGNGNIYSFNNSTGDLSLTASAVPEPATYAALAGLLSLIGVIAVRRRNKAAV